MSIQKGKYFDVKKTKAYFDAMNTEMDKYIANADITNAEYDAFNASESFKGLTANSVKLLVKNRAGLFLNETVKAQKMVKDAQKYTLTTFANIVDSAPNARIEYDTLRTIETDFKEFYNKFRHISHRVDNLSDDLNREFGYYANFGKPNAPAVINEFNSFCGGESDGVGYLSECINKLVRFDEITHEYITRKEINTHATTISTKAKSVGAALMAPVEKSKQLKDIVVTKISDADVPKNGDGVNGKYAALQKQYGFTDGEMEYLEENYPGLLSSLYGASMYSTSDAEKIYGVILTKLYDSGIRCYYTESSRLIENYNLTDDQKKYIENLKSLEGYTYTYYDNDGDPHSVKLTSERVASMQVAAAGLYEYGKSTEFIAGVLGNIAFEGGTGHIENSKYADSEPRYLRALEHYFEYQTIVSPTEAEIIKGGVFDKNFADKRIYSIDNPEKFLSNLETYRKDAESDNICGIGMCQWTTKGRLEDLLKLYGEGQYNFSDTVQAEVTMLVNELSGEYDNGVDGVDDYCENEYASLDSEEEVRKDAEYFYKNFEIGATDTADNRADVAYDIYESMVEG